MRTRSHSLDAAINEFLEHEQSPRNQKLKEYWSMRESDLIIRGRLIPDSGAIPIFIEMDTCLWGEVLGFRVDNFFTDAECYLENILKIMNYRFSVFKDSVPINKTIPMWFGVVIEPSLFGAKSIFPENKAPYISPDPIVKEYSDLEKLAMPDFYNSGIMPMMHKMYEEMQELAGDDLKISLPNFCRGPIGTAEMLRGTTEFLMDLHLNPEFVHDMMRFINEGRKTWYREKAKFTGEPIPKGVLSNDEVGGPFISGEQYREFVFPYEKELSEFHNGIAYFHSCANTNDVAPIVSELGELGLYDISPWSDMEKVKNALPSDVAIEVNLMSTDDVQLATETQMKEKLGEIKSSMKGRNCCIRADGFENLGNIEKQLSNVQRWADTARDFLDLV